VKQVCKVTLELAPYKMVISSIWDMILRMILFLMNCKPSKVMNLLR